MKLKIQWGSTMDFLFVFMVVCMFVAPNAIIGYLGTSFFILYSYLKILRFKTKISLYFVLEFLFIFYMFLQMIFFSLYSNTVQIVGIRNLFITLIFNVGIFQYVREKGYCLASENYANGLLIGSFILLALYPETIFQDGFSAIAYKGLSMFKIGGVAAVNISWVNSIGIVLLWPIFLMKREKKTLLKIMFLLFFVLITGRRKIFLILLTAFVGGSYLFAMKGGFQKVVKAIIIGIFSLLGVYLLITQVPILYNFIGKRLVNALVYIFSSDVPSGDSSLIVRDRLTIMAKNAWNDSPIWGQGYNSFALKYNNEGYYSHNNYLEILVSFGIVGMGLYYLKYLYIVFIAINAKRKNLLNKWFYQYLILNLIALIVLERYQITYMYRVFTVILIFMVSVLTNPKKGVFEDLS